MNHIFNSYVYAALEDVPLNTATPPETADQSSTTNVVFEDAEKLLDALRKSSLCYPLLSGFLTSFQNHWFTFLVCYLS